MAKRDGLLLIGLGLFLVFFLSRPSKSSRKKISLAVSYPRAVRSQVGQLEPPAQEEAETQEIVEEREVEKIPREVPFYKNREEWDITWSKEGLPVKVVVHRRAVVGKFA